MALGAQTVLALATPFGGNRPKQLGLFGDSQTNRSFYSSSNAADGVSPPSYIVLGAQTNSYRSYGWATWVPALTGQQYEVLYSWARQGNGVIEADGPPPGWNLEAQITQALHSPLWAYIDEVVINIGFNDYAYPVSQVIAALTQQLQRINKPITLMSVFPRSDATQTVVSGDGSQVWAWYLQYNQALYNLVQASSGKLSWVECHGLVNDPATSPDGWGTNMSIDLIHSDNASAFLGALAFARAKVGSWSTGSLPIWPHNAGAATSGATGLNQGFANACFGTASGGSGATGTVAGSLTVAALAGGSAVGSVATCDIPGGVGNMQTLVVTSAGANSGVSVTSASFHAAGGTFLTPGDIAWGQGLFQIPGSQALYPKSCTFRLNGFKSPLTWSMSFCPLEAAEEVALPITETTNLLIRTPPMLIPPGLAFSSLTLSALFTFAAAGDCTVKFSNWHCVRFPQGAGFLGLV